MVNRWCDITTGDGSDEHTSGVHGIDWTTTICAQSGASSECTP